MKRFLLLLSCFCAFAINDLLAAPPSYVRTKDGVIIFTDPAFTGTSNAVKLEVISPLHPLSPLQLFSKKNEPGWLTASYANDKHQERFILILSHRVKQSNWIMTHMTWR